ncbi:MAG: alpha/beta fold hydrolase [Bradymonadaceae bacterium]|nr:alpha/beta fold hydrolase [Lujinxingiaceae bacterium]
MPDFSDNHRLTAALLTVLLSSASCATTKTGAQTMTVTLTHDAIERSYLLAAPEGIAGRAPLVLVLHGGNGNAAKTQRAFGLNALAAREGFVVAYPEAINHLWNDGRDDAEFQDITIDDVGYLLAVVEDAASKLAIDRSRVYVLGFSNGGMMTQRLACEQTATFAGFATLIAQMPEPLAARCKPSAPAPMMFINGTADPIMPFDGGTVLKKRGRVTSTRASTAFWREHNGCLNQTTRATHDRDPDDALLTHVDTYDQACAQAPVVLVTVEGGGHTWPGGPQYRLQRRIGPASNDLDSRELVWSFFAPLRRAVE